MTNNATPTGRLQVEIGVQDVAGARIALEEGADRVELCSALDFFGGLTPSAGAISTVVETALAAGRDDFVHILIRPRGGGFVYDEDELALTVAEIDAARRLGASGVVIGALTHEGEVDRDATARLVEAADGMLVTFHRAIDVVSSPVAAAETLAGLGIRRILTSGGAARSADGVAVLRDLVAVADGRLQIMAGGGVTVATVAALAETGIDAIHLSAKASVMSSPSGPGGGDSSYSATDRDIARAAVAAARQAR